jgi:Leucine-rich repeat (LRR) protein
MDVPCQFWMDTCGYKCIVSNVTLTNPNEIKSFVGVHGINYDNSAVTTIIFDYCILAAFPRHLAKFFPKLRTIMVNSCELKAICKEDLRGYPNLIVLDLVDNEIVEVPGDLFQYTPKIKFFDFSANRIQWIGPMLLNHLPQLTGAGFSDNRTIDVSYYKLNRKKMANLKGAIRNRCRPMLSLTDIACLKLLTLKNVDRDRIVKLWALRSVHFGQFVHEFCKLKI